MVTTKCKTAAGGLFDTLNRLDAFIGRLQLHFYTVQAASSKVRKMDVQGFLDRYESDAAVPDMFSTLALEPLLIPNVTSLMVAQATSAYVRRILEEHVSVNFRLFIV